MVKNDDFSPAQKTLFAYIKYSSLPMLQQEENPLLGFDRLSMEQPTWIEMGIGALKNSL